MTPTDASSDRYRTILDRKSLKRCITALIDLIRQIRISKRPKRITEALSLFKLVNEYYSDLKELDEEYRRLLLAIVFNKHKRPLIEAARDYEAAQTHSNFRGVSYRQ